MNGGSAGKGNREILHLSGIWVQPRDFIGDSKIRNPKIAFFIRSGAEGHAARPGHVILDVHNVHGVIAERPQVALYSGISAGDFGSTESGPNSLVRYASISSAS